MHHLDGAAGQAEGHGPKRALTSPVGDLVECSSGVGDISTGSTSKGEWSFSTKPRTDYSVRVAGEHVVRTMHIA